MKTILLIIALLPSLVLAGPAQDQAQTVMDSIKGGAVSPALALTVLDGYAYASDLKPHLPWITILVEGKEVQVQRDPDDMTTEQKATFYLQEVKREQINRRNKYRTGKKRAELAGDQADIDGQVAAEIVTDL